MISHTDIKSYPDRVGIPQFCPFTFAFFLTFSSVAKSGIYQLSNHHAYYAKQTQISPFMAQKQRFTEKTNPIQTQFKPKRTQFAPMVQGRRRKTDADGEGGTTQISNYTSIDLWRI